jgi:hypothetical protein
MRTMAESVEKDRKIEKENRKWELKDLRREEKAKKRHLNVEICSELIDLIMDVADEAFESKEIPKPKWREWMEVFSQGKKVSEINLVINADEGKKESMSPMLGAATDPQKILAEASSEPIYEDFLQYICMTGPLNLRLIAPEHWHKLAETVTGSKIETHFLNQLYIPSNKDLG